MSRLSAMDAQRILYLNRSKLQTPEAIAARLGRSVAAVEQVLANNERCAIQVRQPTGGTLRAKKQVKAA